MSCQIEFYETERGNQPARQFIEFLYAHDSKEWKKVQRRIHQLEQLGSQIYQLGETVARKFKAEGFSELKAGKNRIFFFFIVGNRAILLHGFKKQEQKTPQYEKDRAEQEMKDYMNRYQ